MVNLVKIVGSISICLALIACASTPPEQACLREIQTDNKGRDFILPLQRHLVPIFYTTKVYNSDTKLISGELSGKSGKVICVEPLPSNRMGAQSLYVVQITGMTAPLYLDGSKAYQLFSEGEEISKYSAAMESLRSVVPKTIWPRGIQSVWLSAHETAGTGVTISDFQAITVEGFSLGTDEQGTHRVQMTVRLPDGRTAYSLFDAITPTSTFNNRWHTFDPLQGLTADEISQVRSKVPKIGMRTSLVRLILGTPQDINRTRTAGIEMEQYVYRTANGRTSYYYFYNNILQTIQD
jgi:hypothetical protein